MKKRLLVGLLASGMLMAASLSPALAGPLNYACPPDFERVGVGGELDRNENGYICVKHVETGGLFIRMHFIEIDDHPTPRHG